MAIYSVVYKGFTGGKQTHESRVQVQADDREEAVWLFHHGTTPDLPTEVEVKIDWRTLRCERPNAKPRVWVLPLAE